MKQQKHETVKCPTCQEPQATPERREFVKDIGECQLCDHLHLDNQEQDED